MSDTLPTKVPLSPEVELLLCCARKELDEKTSQRIKELTERSINWNCLLDEANRHGMTPLLFWHFQHLHPPGIPELILTRLSESFVAHSRHNLLLTDELVNLVRAFQSHNIPLVSFKGPTLAVKAYGNIALRQFGDLDVLIHVRDFAKAVDLLAARGYRPDIQLTQSQTSLFLRTQRVLVFVNETHGAILELHWGIKPSYFHVALDEERLWERLDTLKLGETELQVLSAQDLVLYLCAHGAKHFWERIEWLGGLGELLRNSKDPVFWNRLVESAYETQSERVLFLALLLLNDLLGADIPEQVLRKVKGARKVKFLAGKVVEWYANQQTHSLGLMQRTLFYARLNRRFWQSIRYSVGSAITPSDADIRMFSLPRFAFLLYRLVRPFRLAGRYGVNAR